MMMMIIAAAWGSRRYDTTLGWLWPKRQ